MKSTNAAALALWLADNVELIARHERAGECHRQIQQCIDRILRMINRPIPPRFCGPCPQMLDDGQRCNTALLADRDAAEVVCSHCRTLHNIAEIETKLWAEVGEWLLTPQEVIMVMRHFGEPVGESTLRRWRASGKLQPRGFRDGRPRYWPGDVRELRNAKHARAS